MFIINRIEIVDLLKSLTLADAKAYAADPEKWTHVTDNYLDVVGLRRTRANVEAVEDRFEQLLAEAR